MEAKYAPPGFLSIVYCLLARSKGGAADPCPFWARGREAPDGGTRGDAPQYFRGRLPPPPIWPETRFEEDCLSRLELESIWPTAEGGVPSWFTKCNNQEKRS